MKIHYFLLKMMVRLSIQSEKSFMTLKIYIELLEDEFKKTTKKMRDYIVVFKKYSKQVNNLKELNC